MAFRMRSASACPASWRTSYGLGGAIPFALELVRQLAGEAEADRIRNAIAYRH